MRVRRISMIVAVMLVYVLLTVLALVGTIAGTGQGRMLTTIVLAVMLAFTFAMLVVSYVRERAKENESNRMLELASQTLTFMRQGLSMDSAQAVCDLLLPAFSADAVALTDREVVMGYAGVDRDLHTPGVPIQSDSTHETLEDGMTRIAVSAIEIGFPHDSGHLTAGIIAPLVVGDRIVGTLKLYYASQADLTESKLGTVESMAQLLSTQLSLAYLQEQIELASQMELRAMQAQINPHFLFNTINTIAAITRTDPAKARVMLREFAIYYRRLLENSEDLIPLGKEIEQTERYLMFQRARFGEDTIQMQIHIEPGLEELRVPSFVLQPIVENSVGHGRRPDGTTLHIDVNVYHAAKSVIIEVKDDGVGISSERLDGVLEGTESSGIGIALKNVNARLKVCFGDVSGLYIDSHEGTGTTVYLSLYDALVKQPLLAGDASDEGEEVSDAASAGVPKPPIGEAAPDARPLA